MPLWMMLVISIAVLTGTTAALRLLRRKHASERLVGMASSVVLTFLQKLSLVATITGAAFMFSLVVIRWVGTRIDAGALPGFITWVHGMRESAEALDQRLTGAILVVVTLAAALLLHRMARRSAESAREEQVQAVQARLAQLPALPDTPAMAAVREELQHAQRVLLSYVPDPAAPVARYESLRQNMPDLERRLARLDAERRVSSDPSFAAMISRRLRPLEGTLAFFTSRGFVGLLDRSSKLAGILVLTFWFASLVGLQINGASRMATPVAAQLQDLVVERRSQEALASWLTGTASEDLPNAFRASKDDPAKFTPIENDTVLAIARWYELTQAEGLKWVPVDSAGGVVFQPRIPPWPSGAGGPPAEPSPHGPSPNDGTWPWSGSPETPAGRDFALTLNQLKEARPSLWERIVERWRAGIEEFSIPADEHQIVGLALGKIISSAGGIESVHPDLRPVAEEFLDDFGEATGRRYARSRMLRLLAHWITGVNKQSKEPYAAHAPFPLTSRERAALERAAAALNEAGGKALSASVGPISPMPSPATTVAAPSATPVTSDPIQPPSSKPPRREAPGPLVTPRKRGEGTEVLHCEKRTCINGVCGPWLPHSGPDCANAPIVPIPRRLP